MFCLFRWIKLWSDTALYQAEKILPHLFVILFGFKQLNEHEVIPRDIDPGTYFGRRCWLTAATPKLISFPPVQCEASLWCLQHTPDPLQQGQHFKVISPHLKSCCLKGVCRTGNTNKICMLPTCSSLNFSRHFTSFSILWLPLSVCK